MKFFKFLALLVIVFSFTNCTVKERIVFNEDGSGNYLVSFDMAQVMEQMKSSFSEGEATEDSEKPKGKVMDTTMVFSEIMETYKDSVAALPEEKRLALEAVKDMYMKMTMDEDNGVFDFGIGMEFKTINDLKDINDKIEKAKSLNAQNNQADAIKGSPLGKYMMNDKNKVSYEMVGNNFRRTTTVFENNAEEVDFNSDDETEKEYLDFFKESYYIIEYTFPKKILNHSFKNATISKDKRTITCKVDWLECLKDPKILDVNITFANE